MCVTSDCGASCLDQQNLCNLHTYTADPWSLLAKLKWTELHSALPLLQLMSHAASVSSLLEADCAGECLLQFLSDLEVINLASTCQAWRQAISFLLIPWLKDISEGLERRPLACKVSVRTVLSAVALNGADRTTGTPLCSHTRSATCIVTTSHLCSQLAGEQQVYSQGHVV